MNPIQQFLHNTAYKTLSHIFLKAISLAYSILMIRSLSKEDYGLLALILTVVAITNQISNFGYPTMLVKTISAFHPTEPAKAKGCFQFIFKIYLALTLVFALILFLAAPWIADFYATKTAAPLLRLAALLFLFQSLASFYEYFFTGLNQYKKYFAKILIPREILSLSLIIFSLWLGYSIQGIVFAYTIATLTVLLIALWTSLSWFQKISTPIDKKWMVRSALEITPGSIASIGINYLDTLVVGAVLGLGVLATYRVSLGIILMVVTLFPLGTFMMPTLHQLKEEERSLFVNDILKLSLFLLLPGIFFIYSFSGEILLLFFGVKYMQSGWILSTLSFLILAMVFHQMFINILSFQKQFKILSSISVLGTVFYFLLLYFLMQLLEIRGALIAILATHFLMILAMNYFVKRGGIPTAISGKTLLTFFPLIVNFANRPEVSLSQRLLLFLASACVFLLMTLWTKSWKFHFFATTE